MSPSLKPAPGKVAGERLAERVGERVREVSADLPFELQSKIFEQTAASALAGAGLSVTLIGSLLRDAPPSIWGSVICFAAAAYVAGAGNNVLVEALFRRQPVLKRCKAYQAVAAILMGMAIGVLSYSVYVTGQHRGAAPPHVIAASAAH